MFQFEAQDLGVKQGPLQVRTELPSLWPGWTLAAWFATPHGLLGGQRPVDALAQNVAAVVRAAQSVGWAAGLSPQRVLDAHDVRDVHDPRQAVARV